MFRLNVIRRRRKEQLAASWPRAVTKQASSSFVIHINHLLSLKLLLLACLLISNNITPSHQLKHQPPTSTQLHRLTSNDANANANSHLHAHYSHYSNKLQQQQNNLINRQLVAESLINEDATTTTTTTTATPAPQETPDFEEAIGNHTVPMGRDAQLSCKISNLGNFRTAWLRVEDKGILTIHNNVITRNYRFGLLNNENERNFILTIKNVQPSDRGGYMCQINSVPMKYALGYLDVLTPPVFDDGPQTSSIVTTNQEGNSLPSDGDISDSSSSSSSSSAAAATANAPTSNSSQVTVRENSSATLSCRASGHPAPTITWRREDGRPILLNGIDSSLDNSPIEIKDTSSLTFSSIHRTNSGAYLCIASNGVQPAASKRQLLDVQFSPIVTLPRAEVPSQVGQREAKLECLVELNPVGSYHWIKLATTTTNTDRRPMVTNQEDDLWLIEHDELMQSDKFDIVMKQINSEKVHMILTLRNIEKLDFSWYKCVARNSLGLQSNFIRFYESTAPLPPIQVAATSSQQQQSSSSFSFNSMFGRGSSSSASSAAEQQQQDEPQPNEEQDGGGGGKPGGQMKPGRAHTRSSWTQRSRTRAESNGGANSATLATKPLQMVSLVPHLLSLLLVFTLFINENHLRRHL